MQRLCRIVLSSYPKVQKYLWSAFFLAPHSDVGFYPDASHCCCPPPPRVCEVLVFFGRYVGKSNRVGRFFASFGELWRGVCNAEADVNKCMCAPTSALHVRTALLMLEGLGIWPISQLNTRKRKGRSFPRIRVQSCNLVFFKLDICSEPGLFLCVDLR